MCVRLSPRPQTLASHPSSVLHLHLKLPLRISLTPAATRASTQHGHPEHPDLPLPLVLPLAFQPTLPQGNFEKHNRFQLMLNHAFEDETAVRSLLQAWQNTRDLYVSSVGCAPDLHLDDTRSVIVPQHEERLARLEWDGVARLLDPAGASLGARRLDRCGLGWTSEMTLFLRPQAPEPDFRRAFDEMEHYCDMLFFYGEYDTFHKDVRNFTWIRVEAGVKAWFYYIEPPGREDDIDATNSLCRPLKFMDRLLRCRWIIPFTFFSGMLFYFERVQLSNRTNVVADSKFVYIYMIQQLDKIDIAMAVSAQLLPSKTDQTRKLSTQDRPREAWSCHSLQFFTVHCSSSLLTLAKNMTHGCMPLDGNSDVDMSINVPVDPKPSMLEDGVDQSVEAAVSDIVMFCEKIALLALGIYLFAEMFVYELLEIGGVVPTETT
ncbi:hypothetical protein KCU65_g301, partial [Aureobasidium melanogenum]